MEPYTTHGQIDPPRIGRGVALFVIGSLFLAFGVFGILAGADGRAEGATAIGSGAIGIGTVAIVIGFWVNLFSKIEARLIDIQRVTVESRAPSELPDTADYAAKLKLWKDTLS
jgi:hypothetical protein